MTNSVNLIINRVVMEALLGMDSLSLKQGKNTALCVVETESSVQISTGKCGKYLCAVFLEHQHIFSNF